MSTIILAFKVLGILGVVIIAFVALFSWGIDKLMDWFGRNR